MAQGQQALPANSPAAQHAAELLSQATALYRAGKVADADTAYKIALKAAEELNDPRDSAAIVKVLGWQAGFYRQQLRLTEAWSAAERALALHEPAFGPDDVHTAYLHTLLGMIASQQREYSKAEPHLRAVLDAYSRNGGSKQRDGNAANAAQELGTVFRAQKRFAEAVTVFRVAAALRGQAVPRDPVAIARNMYLLAAVYEEMGQAAEADGAYKEAVAAAENLRGPAVSVLVQMLIGQANFYRNQRRYDDAWSAAQRALTVREAVPGDDAQIVDAIHAQLGAIALFRGEMATAEIQYRLALEGYDRAPIEANRAMAAAAAYELARFPMGKSKYAEAEALLQRSIALREKTVPLDEFALAQALQRLGTVYQMQYRFALAEPLFRRGLEIVRRMKGPEQPEVATSFFLMGSLLFAAGRYSDAEGPFLSALTIRSKHDDLVAISEVEVHLAVVYRYLGRMDEAERLARRALASREAKLKPDDISIADALFNLAATYRWQSRYSEAEPLLRRALAIREAALGSDNPLVLADLNSLAMCLDGMGRSAEAEPILRRALAGREKVLGHDNPDVADSLVNLISLLRGQGRFAEAAQIAELPLEIYCKALGPAHPTVVRGLRTLAIIYQDRAEFAKAEELLREALKIRQATYGADHADVAGSYVDLARLSLARRQFEEAAGYSSKALAINEKWFGPHDVRIVPALRDLASLRILLDQLPVAEELLNRALAICDRVQGAESISVAMLSMDLAAVRRLQGKLGDAEMYYERPLAIYRKLLGSRHPWVAYALDMRAALDVTLGQPLEAEKRYDEAIEIVVAAYGENSPALNGLLNNKATLLLQLGRVGEAERYFKRAIELLRAGAGKETWALAVVLFNLGQLYENMGRTEEAERLAKEAVVIANKIFGPDHAPPFYPAATLPPPAQEI
jgi:tetratricopeptide (TPR) repeat protein